MQEIARGMLSLPLRLTQLGVEQFAHLGGPQLRPPNVDVAPFLNPFAGGHDASIGREGLRRALRGWLSNAVGWGAFSPSANSRSILDMVTRAPELMQLAAARNQSRVQWKETSNKMRAYFLFTNADRAAGFGVSENGELPTLATRFDAMPPYDGLWSTEGLGYYYAAAQIQSHPALQQLLATELSGEIAERYLIPLHTGMGLAFALRQLESLSQRTPGEVVRQHLEAFLELCQTNAREGYAPAAAEALGLIAKLLKPALLSTLDRELGELDAKHLGPFWHGVGRALYFSPTSILPCGSLVWPGIDKARSEPPHAIGRANAVAGFAWAVTLINIRNPDVLEMFVRRHGAELGDAFANGVGSALSVWHDWAPESPFIDDLCRHDPRHLEPSARSYWERTTRGGDQARHHYDQLKRARRLGDLFHFAGTET